MILLAVFASFMQVGCGKGDSNTSPTQAPPLRSVSPEERARYSILDASLDSANLQQSFLNQVQGTWVHQAQGAEEISEFKRREFMFDLS